MCDLHSANAERYLGFSCGAYQVHVLSAMIDKVQYILPVQFPEIMSAETIRLALSLKEMRCRYHCAPQVKSPFF